MQQEALRDLPKVDRFLEDPRIQTLIQELGRTKVLSAIREELTQTRTYILEGRSIPTELHILIDKVQMLLNKNEQYQLRRVVNGTGVVLHTNFGRSILPASALEHLQNTAGHYTNLEYDLNAGLRGSRYSHVVSLLTKITGAESALVVNNNAAAVLLTLSALAYEKSVIVSRGELVEIGGGFRIPDVMVQSGATLVEVGTTNKTRLADYENAIDDQTELLMKIHTSNFKIVGFTESVSISELAKLKEGRDLLVIDDLGSGSLLDLSTYGLTQEPTVMDSLKSGSDLVLFSGDKLLGGPQCGIIVGRKTAIERLKKHPLNRALRIDKLSLAALEGTLKLYEDPDIALAEIPSLNMLTKKLETLSADAKALHESLTSSDVLFRTYDLEIVDTQSEVGGGAMPLTALPSLGISIKPKNASVQSLTDALRSVEVPIIGKVKNDHLILDLRTILVEDHHWIKKGLLEVEAIK